MSMIILAIETSCDETAAAIVKFDKKKIRILANIVSSQIKIHRKYGGVVPSLASRMHLKNMIPVLNRAFKSAKISKDKINYVAVTNGPGLIPALMIGVNAAKTLSYSLNKPLIGTNHLEGHIYANWLKSINKIQSSMLREPEFPVLCLIVSGGHTQLVLMKRDLNYKVIGETVDDAAGEAFDKVAKLLELGYPGGPIIEKLAKSGNKGRFKFTRPMINSGNYNFSFSGLKTAVLYETKLRYAKINSKFKIQNSKFKQDMAASFQQTIIDVLIYKTVKAAKEYKAKTILLGGGVSANKELQKQFEKAVNKKLPNSKFQIPNSSLSTDNALMITVAAYKHILNNKNIKDWRSVEADANLKIVSSTEY